MIGGNEIACIEVKTTSTNDIGERVPTWKAVQGVLGWLDLMSGEAKYTSYDAKVQESSHVFVADYTSLDERISAENSRMVICGNTYDITLIDNPMGLNRQLEFYLRFTGGR